MKYGEPFTPLQQFSGILNGFGVVVSVVVCLYARCGAIYGCLASFRCNVMVEKISLMLRMVVSSCGFLG